MDLVLVSPNAKPVVCKIMNYGKYKFEQAKREKEAKKKQKVLERAELYCSGENYIVKENQRRRRILLAGFFLAMRE